MKGRTCNFSATFSQSILERQYIIPHSSKCFSLMKLSMSSTHFFVLGNTEYLWYSESTVVKFKKGDHFNFQQPEFPFENYRKFGRLKLCRKTMQLTRPRACTTSSLTLAVAVAVKANTGVVGNFCFKIPRPWTRNSKLLNLGFELQRRDVES